MLVSVQAGPAPCSPSGSLANSLKAAVPNYGVSGMPIKNGRFRLNIGGVLGGVLGLLIAWAVLPPQPAADHHAPRKLIGAFVLGAALFGDYLVERKRAKSAKRGA
jgi:hypothetical protein